MYQRIITTWNGSPASFIRYQDYLSSSIGRIGKNGMSKEDRRREAMRQYKEKCKKEWKKREEWEKKYFGEIK